MTCLFVIDIALAEGDFAKYYAIKTQLELQNIEEQEELVITMIFILFIVIFWRTMCCQET